MTFEQENEDYIDYSINKNNDNFIIFNNKKI